MADDATSTPEHDDATDAQARARIDDLRRRLEEAALEAVAQRDRYEAAARERDAARVELATVTQELALVRASRSYQAAERIRRLLHR